MRTNVETEDGRAAEMMERWAGIALDRVVGETFDGKTVFFDGRHFERCNFTNCTIIIRAARFGLVNCSITKSQFQYDGPAQATALLIAGGAPLPTPPRTIQR